MFNCKNSIKRIVIATNIRLLANHIVEELERIIPLHIRLMPIKTTRMEKIQFLISPSNRYFISIENNAI